MINIKYIKFENKKFKFFQNFVIFYFLIKIIINKYINKQRIDKHFI